MPLPSIAYRLARIAVGDGIATQTLRPVNALDIAAGHALLMAAGGVLVAEDGVPVTYNEQGESRPSACFGGAPKAVDALRARTWRGSKEPRREPRVTLTWPRTVPEAMLDRAAGCLLGLAIGGDLGPDTELALIVARALVGLHGLRRRRGRRGGDGMGGERAARSAAPRRWSAPSRIGIWARDPERPPPSRRRDRRQAPANAALAAAIAVGVPGGTPDAMRRCSAMPGLSLPEPDATAWTSAVRRRVGRCRVWAKCVPGASGHARSDLAARCGPWRGAAETRDLLDRRPGRPRRGTVMPGSTHDLL